MELRTTGNNCIQYTASSDAQSPASRRWSTADGNEAHEEIAEKNDVIFAFRAVYMRRLFPAARFGGLLDLLADGTISSQAAKSVLRTMYQVRLRLFFPASSAAWELSSSGWDVEYNLKKNTFFRTQPIHDCLFAPK